MQKLALVLLLFLLAGCGGIAQTATAVKTNAPSPTPRPDRHWRVGETLQTDTWLMTVDSAKAIADLGGTSGIVDLVVEVGLQNISSKAQPMSSLFFDVRNARGDKASSAYLGPGYPDIGGTIAVNGLDHGFLGFQVSASEHQFMLEYDDFSYFIIWDLSV
jgi:hypothetical protein